MPYLSTITTTTITTTSPLQVADEHSLDVQLGMANAPTAAPSRAQAAKTQEDDLGARLAELRGK
jgi:hypothetical protein